MSKKDNFRYLVSYVLQLRRLKTKIECEKIEEHFLHWELSSQGFFPPAKQGDVSFPL